MPTTTCTRRPSAFTRHLPAEYDGSDQVRPGERRTKIAIRNVISDYIPNPTFEVVAAPGAQEEYFKSGNPDGKTLPGDPRQADACHPGVP